ESRAALDVEADPRGYGPEARGGFEFRSSSLIEKERGPRPKPRGMRNLAWNGAVAEAPVRSRPQPRGATSSAACYTFLAPCPPPSEALSRRSPDAGAPFGRRARRRKRRGGSGTKGPPASPRTTTGAPSRSSAARSTGG